MSDKKPNKLDEVNATLDRFAKLIEENAQQSRKDKDKYDRQLAKDKAEAKAEAKRRRQEWDRQRAEDKAEAKKRQQEWDRQRVEDKAKAEAEAKQRQQEWDRQRAEDKAEAKQRQQEWDRQMANLRDQVGGQANSIGELTEAMTVSDNIINLINKFSEIDVDYFSFNVTKKYPAINSKGKKIRKQHEVDGFASGPKVVVVIEAKTTLNEDDVEYFVEQRLANFKLAYPEHADKTIYGAVTFVRTDNKAFALAEQHGLFVIKASPPVVELVNSEGFEPTEVA